MRGVAIRLMACVVGIALTASFPAAARGQAKGVPDAPAPAETVLARYAGFELPREFETTNHRNLPKGSYDLVLIETGGRYFIHLVNRETREGVRVPAKTTGEIEGAMPEETEVSIRTERGRDSLLFDCGKFKATLALKQANG